ncbi:MAG: non-homologous end-joining DNA ligase [Gemmatimonadota bacterium]|nr:non-homologous end-joining DNA ligase [Gemmatimonadota bacterium]
MSEETLRFGRYSVEISSRDKVLFPEASVTKGEMVDYYREIADRMVRYLEDRPLVMQRFPEGIDEEGFYQKDAPDYFPDWIDTVTVEKKGGTVDHVVCGNAATLVYLANQNVITPHVWLSRVDALDCPDRLIFDLDPPDDDFEIVREAARALGDLLDDLGLAAWPMATGGRGLHLVVPLDRSEAFDPVRDFAHRVADLLAGRHPDRFTTATRKKKRKGRLFLDYLRNAYAQTGVPPYAVRPRPGAPVAVPLDWDDLDDPDLRGNVYTVKNVLDRVSRRDDPWAGMMRHARSLEKPRARLETLEENERDEPAGA